VSELEHGLLGEMRNKLIDVFLDILILRELEKGPLGCYDVVSLIHTKYGSQLSSGKTYSRLYSLERKGLARSRLNSNKRVFVLTESGRETIREIANEKNRILGYLLNLIEGE
jgi:DNA-binding PadR family transcriptional regulator